VVRSYRCSSPAHSDASPPRKSRFIYPTAGFTPLGFPRLRGIRSTFAPLQGGPRGCPVNQSPETGEPRPYKADHGGYFSVRLILGSGSLGWINQRMSIGQVQKARQAASCLPATLAAAHQTARLDEQAVELTDILPGDLPGNRLTEDSAPRSLLSQLRGPDSKL